MNLDDIYKDEDRRLTIHLGCRNVELIGDDASESRNKEDKDVDVAIEESVRPNQEDALRRNLVPHRQSNRNLCHTELDVRKLYSSAMQPTWLDLGTDLVDSLAVFRRVV